MMRKELRRFTKGRVAELNPRDVVRAFIDECMSRTLWQRLRLGLGLVMKSWKILPVHVTVDEVRKEKGPHPAVAAETGTEAK